MKERPMRNMLIATAAAALCAAALPAAAPQANDRAAQPSQPRARAGTDDQRRICVTEPASESRINRRICRTAREWREANDTDDQR